MNLSAETVEHVARLAHVGLSPSEVEDLTIDLASVVDHVNKLRAVDTTDVEPTAHVLPMENVWREDVERPSWSPEAVVANAPHQTRNQFAVKAIFD